MGVAAPVFYVTGETVDTVTSTIQSAASSMIGLDALDLSSLLAAAKSCCEAQPAALAGLELAVYDLWAKLTSTDLREHFGGGARSVQTDMTIPIVDAIQAEQSASSLTALGFSYLKVKVGDPQGVRADIERVDAVRRAAPDARLRIDANQGFTPELALGFINHLFSEDAPVDFIEQPVVKTDHNGLRAVRDQSPYPIFADESVCSAIDAQTLIDLKAVDGIVVKLMKSGVSGAIEILEICRNSGTKTMMGCMLESGLGISAAMAIGIGYKTDLFDLDSHRLLSPIPGLTLPFHCDQDMLIWDGDAYGWGTLQKD